MVKVAVPQNKKNGVRVKGVKKQSTSVAIASNLLLSDINNDCLMSIFDYLDIVSLMSLCKTNERFKAIIVDHVVSLKTFQFRELSSRVSVQKLFELFGKSMTKITIDFDDIKIVRRGYTSLEEFLHLVMDHCTPGKLQQLTMTGFSSNSMVVNPKLFADVRKYFENLQTFQIAANPMGVIQNSENFNAFMEWIPKQNLRELNLHSLRTLGTWFTKENFPNLQMCHICVCQSHWPWQILNFDPLIQKVKEYLASKPDLKIFDYGGPSRETILVELSRHLPNVQRVCVVKNMMVDDNNNNNVWNKAAIREKWKHLSEFTNLQDFALESFATNFGNSGEIFRILAKLNTINTLELFSGYTTASNIDPVMVDSLRQLTKLKTLRLVRFGHGGHELLMDQMFEHFLGLEECTFGDDVHTIKQAPIIQLVKLARNLRCLNIECKVTSFTSTFYRKLMKIRKVTNPDKPLTIYVNGSIVDKCMANLSKRSYKPNIITLKSRYNQKPESFQLN